MKRGVAIVLALLLLACDKDSGWRQHDIPPLAGTDIKRAADTAQLNEGRLLFQRHCAVCHGASAEGDPDWRRPGTDGNYPPPPLNGSGHAWHHPHSMLHEMIKDGSPLDSEGRPSGKMPAWRQKLSDQQIDALIAWFQSLWPDQVYALWSERQRRESAP